MEYPKRIQSLVNYPNCGAVKKGEIGTWTGKGYYYNFPSQSHYGTNWDDPKLYKILEEEPNYEIY